MARTCSLTAALFGATLAPLAAGAAHAEAPQQTTATYDDWTLRCVIQPGPPLSRTCEMVQSTHVQGQTAVLTQIAIGGARKGQPLRMVVQVPIDVWLPTGIRVVVNDKDPGVSAAFKRCLPGVCLADVELRDDAIKKLRGAAEPGKLQFKDANQKDLSLPVSFKGFEAAFEALVRDTM